MTYFAFIFQRVNLDRDRFKSSGKKYHMMPHRIDWIYGYFSIKNIEMDEKILRETIIHAHITMP